MASKSKIEAPQVYLPKGGGAIKGMGESFAPQAFSGSAGFSLALPGATARGFTPSLSIGYASSAGNGIFGLGFHLPISSITRKTSKNLPHYDDTDAFDSDEGELVLLLDQNLKPVVCQKEYQGLVYRVTQYRPRLEGSYSEIQHWVSLADGQSFWQVRSSADHVEYYGLSPASRIVDPADPARIFQWLIDEAHDDHGNVIRYHYKAEDGVNIPDSIHEAGRNHTTQRYPILVEYGNYIYQDDGQEKVNFSFQLAFDYGQISLGDPSEMTGNWSARPDPFSNYHPRFEVRTLRLCRRVLLYHQFHDQNNGQPFLTHSLTFDYALTSTGISQMQSILETGYRLESGSYWSETIPPIQFSYTPFDPETSLWQTMEVQGGEMLPGELSKEGFLPVDLHGEGLPGMLYAHDQVTQYFAPMGEGRYAPADLNMHFPIDRELGDGRLNLASVNGNGRKDLVVTGGGRSGYYPASDKGRFEAWRNFSSMPAEILTDAHQIVDLTGRGLGDLLVFDAPYLRFYPAEGEHGYGSAHVQELAPDFPAYTANYREEVLDFMDILGDGLQHRVRVRAGSVEVWPNLGYGKFGTKVALENAPQFGGTLDASRLHFADIDGSGTMDFVYVFPDRIEVYFNQSGNQFSAATILPLPRFYDDLCQVNFMDVRGNGTTCMVLSKTHSEVTHYFLDFCKKNKPYLLDLTDNGMGLRTRLHYSSTVQQYLKDKRNGRSWATRLFFPVHVVERIEIREYFNKSRYVQRFAYHDGYYDPVERAFRGFGFTESWDTEHYEKFTPAEDIPGWEVAPIDKALHVWPTYTKTWFETGAYEENALILQQYQKEFWNGDDEAFPHLRATLGPEIILSDGDTYREAFVALAGQVLRSELYGLDRTELAKNPYTVSETALHVRMVQPRGHNRHPVFQVDPLESLSYTYDRNPLDPLITHSLSLAVDEYGHDLLSASVAYPRRDQEGVVVYPEQQVLQVALSQSSYIHVLLNDQPNPADDCRLIGLPWEDRGFQLNGLSPANGSYFTVDDLRTQVEAALQAQIPSHQPFTSGSQARLQSWGRTYYWNADQSAVEAGGVAHKRALTHHCESAELAADQAQQLYGAKFPNGNLNTVLNKEAGYFLADGYWWNRGLIQYYATEYTQFYLPVKTDNGFADVPAGSSLEHLSTVTYDPYCLLPIATITLLDGGISLTTRVINDYTAMGPVQSTDPNGTVTQVLLDPLGQTIVSTVSGSEGGKPVGDLDLSQYVIQSDATKDSVLANPAQYLQGASSYFYYDFFAFVNEKQPACAISVTRQTHVHALPTGVSAPLQLVVAYSDSLGRALVGKAKDIGHWHATGRTVCDNKNQPCQQYLPYKSNTADYIPQEQLLQDKNVVPPTIMRYDPLGRVTRTDSPKGFFSRSVYSPWMHQSWDQNDTVKEAPFYLANINNTDPGFANSLDALQKAAAHYGTPATVITDNMGHTIRSIVSNLGQVNADDLDAMAETISETGSGVFTALVTAGYLSANGWILPAFQPYQSGFQLELQSPYNQLEEQLTAYLMQSCLTSYSYNDFQGRPLVTMDPRLYYAYLQSGQKAANFEWTYAMEGNALLTASADAGVHLALDNIYGWVCYVWDARGFTTRAAYDQLQRPVSKHIQGDDGRGLVLDQLVELTLYGEHLADAAHWNLNGKVYKHYGEDGLNTYPAYSIYGSPSRVEQRIRPGYKTEVAWDKNSMQAIEKEPAWTMTYAYNAHGAVTENSLPDGSVLQVGYDEIGIQRTLSRRPKDGKMEPHIVDIQYDANGSRTLVRYANGVQTRYTYEDTTLHLLRMHSTRLEKDSGNGKPGVKALQDLNYTYDPSGNITRKEDLALEQFFTFQAPASPLSYYTYDPLYQLIAATGPLHSGYQPRQMVTAAQQRDGNFVPFKAPTSKGSNLLQQYTQQYQYDNSGNLAQLSHNTQGGQRWHRTYGIAADSNRLNTLGKQTFSYDAGGNSLTMGLYPHIGWAFRNFIQQVQVLQREAANPDAEYYTYDSDGARVRKVWERMQHGGSVWEVEEKRYFNNYEEKRILHRTEKGETVLLHRKTVRLMDGGSAFATIDTWEVDELAREVEQAGKTLTRYTLADAQGSANLELGTEGELRSYEGYLPYGSTAFRAADKNLDQWTQDYGYSGKERDSATGLIYYGFRYYPSWLCRWMNPDPGGTVDGMNLYAFCGGNPATGVDVDGRVGDKASGVITKKYDLKGMIGTTEFGINDFLKNLSVHQSGIISFGVQKVMDLKIQRHKFKKPIKRLKKKIHVEGNVLFRALKDSINSDNTEYFSSKASSQKPVEGIVKRTPPGQVMAKHFSSQMTEFEYNRYGATTSSLSAKLYAIEHDPELADQKNERDAEWSKLGMDDPLNHTSSNLKKYQEAVKIISVGKDKQREWLHIQAVEHGHDSAPDNLVCGVYGANRTMAAFEDMTRELVNTYAGTTKKIYPKVTSTNLPGTLISQNIRYKISLRDEWYGTTVQKKVADVDIAAHQDKFPTDSEWRKSMTNHLRTFFQFPTT